jgi:hypothetical protein
MKQSSWTLKTIVVLGAAGSATAGLAQLPWTLPFAATQQARQDGKVTLTGDAVPASAVFDQLRRAGASFVLDADAVPEGKKLTLHIVDKPAKAALQAVSDALGLDFAERDGVYVLRRRRYAFSIDGPVEMGNGFTWGLPGKEGAPRPGEKLGEPQEGPKGFTFKLDREGLGQKELEELRKQFDKLGEGFKTFSLELRQPDGAGETGPGKTKPELWSFRMADGSNLRKLAQSLSASQKERHAKQGFLTPEDLTPEQRRLLGNLRGTFEITFNDGETSLTVKSRK